MKIKSLILMLLCSAIFLSGCSKAPNKSSSTDLEQSSVTSEVMEEKEKESKLKLSLACSVTDSFNPYSAKTALNRNLSTLMYEPLIELDNSFTPQYRLASKIDTNKSTVTVTLRTASFSDGSSVTADDVVYCAKKAMKSDTRYKYGLEDVSEVSSASYNVVVFKLKKEDPYFINQLDFPIYKAGSDKKTSSDNIEIPPISCGRYSINSAKTELKANTHYYGDKPNIKTIYLINTPDQEALKHNLQIGNITYHYSDLSDCKLLQVRGKYKSVNSNNLVYLGTNMESGLMANCDMRQAVSTAIDRSDITQEAYYQNAVPTNSIFHPDWSQGDNITASVENQINENVYLALLDKIGYNKKDNSGYYVNQVGERLTLNLICYKDNPWRTAAAELIKTQLKAAGIKLNVSKYGWSDYTYALKKGHFDLYIAEVAIGNNMDITELVTKGGSAAYGISYKNKAVTADNTSNSSNTASADTASSDTASKPEAQKDPAGDTARAVAKMYKGEATARDVATAFFGEMPIIPICYRTGMVSYATDISGVSIGITDVFGGIEKVKIK